MPLAPTPPFLPEEGTPPGDRKPPHQPLQPSGKLREFHQYPFLIIVFFPPNSMISITDITRGYKIFDRDIDTWMSEGWFPRCVWINGRRYWESNSLNEFLSGSEVDLPRDSSNRCDLSIFNFVVSLTCGIILVFSFI